MYTCLARCVANHTPKSIRRTLATSSDQLSLRVASPGVLLNAIAHRYSSLSRILLEYVDNALDDCEVRRRNGILHGTTIQVLLDPMSRTVLIRDSGSGMTISQLQRIVTHVGLSNKASIPWLNGRFGFGVHSFRAAADRMTIVSKSSTSDQAFEMVVNRDSAEVVSAPKCVPWPDDEFASSGTYVLLQNIDKHWKSGFNVEIFCKEVEQHFERILAREGIRIFVAEANLAAIKDRIEKQAIQNIKIHSGRVCLPFDYNGVPGKLFERNLAVNGGNVQVKLTISEREYVGHRARFFFLDRRINEVGAVESFLEQSRYKQSLWSHPQLLGYIDLTGLVEPVITRDELKPSEARTELYSRLLELEQPLKDALDEELSRSRDFAFIGLESSLSSILDQVIRQESRGGKLKANRSQIYQDIVVTPRASSKKKDGDANSTKVPCTEKKSRQPTIPIRFCEIAANDMGELKRAQLINNMIEINSQHPDFLRRLKLTKSGKYHFDDRFVEYLAVVISAYSRDWHYSHLKIVPDRMQVYEDVLGTYSELETALRKKLK